MSVANPAISGVWPPPNDTDVILRPTIQVRFAGPGLVDPSTWGPHTFAVYRPGDVVLETGPGTILNSGLEDAAYPLLDGPLRRDRVPGTFALYTSGYPQASGLQISGYFGNSNSVVIGSWTPDNPLAVNTQYTAVLVGDDSQEWSTSDLTFPGVTTWTNAATFTGTGVSGSITVERNYSKTNHTVLYNTSTGYNDTFTIIIENEAGPRFSWSKLSSPGSYSVINEAGQTHNLGDGLIIKFNDSFTLGDVFTLDTYVPRPLANTYVWKFSTGELNFTSPPSEPPAISLIIDNTGTGIGVSSASEADLPLALINALPYNLAYGVSPSIGKIQLEFNKPLLSGSISISDIVISSSALLGLPTVSEQGGAITPTSIEISGVFLNIYI